MRYLIKGYDATGNVVKRSIEASSPDEARLISGIAPTRITSIKEDAVGGLWAKLSNPRPKGEVQAVFMSSLGAILLSGQSLQKGIDKLLDRYKTKFRFDPEKARQHAKTSDLLETLNFDPVAVTLVQVGEQTGTVSEALSKASSNIIYQIKLKEELGKELVMAWVYMAIGATLLSIIIFGFGPVLKEIDSEPGLRLPKGTATSFILSSHTFAQHYWLGVMALFAAIYSQRGLIWRNIRALPVLNWFWSVQKLRNALFFVSGFETLFHAGITEDKAFKLLRSGASAHSKTVFDNAIAALNEGNRLSRVIDNEDWPDAMREGLSGFESAPLDTKKKILGNLTDVLLLQQKFTSKKVAKLAFIFGMGMAVLAILLMVFGAVFPLQQIQAV